MSHLKIIYSFLVFLAFPLVGCVVHQDTARAPISEPLESYDLYFAPTFSAPTHYRFERSSSEYTLYQYFYKGMGGYNPKKLKRTRKIRLTQHNWDELVSIIENGKFWTPMIQNSNNSGGLDGISFIFEGKRGKSSKKIHQYDSYNAFLGDLLDKLDKIQ